MDVYTFGSMVPIGGGTSGWVKLRSGCVGRTQAVGMVRPPAPWASSEETAAEGAPGTGPTPGTWSTGGAEEPGRSGGGCCGGGCCWWRVLVEVSVEIPEEEKKRNPSVFCVFVLTQKFLLKPLSQTDVQRENMRFNISTKRCCW